MLKLGTSSIRLNNIYLSGFMAAGKSTLGPLLATALSWEFEDTDVWIEQRAGMAMSLVFKNLGEQKMRLLETEAIRDLSLNKRQVIALGGGSLLKLENRNLIQENGISIYLRARAETLKNRLLADSQARPLLDEYSGQDLLTKIHHLLETRSSIYESAHLIIDTDEKVVTQVLQEVLQAIDLIS